MRACLANVASIQLRGGVRVHRRSEIHPLVEGVRVQGWCEIHAMDEFSAESGTLLMSCVGMRGLGNKPRC